MARRKVSTAATQKKTKAAPAAPSPRRTHSPDFEAILESMGDVVYTLDLEGRLTYVNARAYELLGYSRDEGAQFLDESFMKVLVPESTGSAVGAIRHRVQFPHDHQFVRLEMRRKDGGTIVLDVHGGPLWRDGRVIGRVGTGRVVEPLAEPAHGGAGQRSNADALQQDRMRIARGLRDAIAQIVFGVTPDRDASESFLLDVKRATQADLARRLNLDDVDLDILRLITGGASNREIGPQVHLSAAAVKDRIRRLMSRLGARRRAELAAHALRLGVA